MKKIVPISSDYFNVIYGTCEEEVE